MTTLPEIKLERPIMMIPGPIEVSPAVKAAYSIDPLNHFAEPFISIFSRTLKKIRQVWKADGSTHPFCIAGSGTLGMEMAVYNLLDPQDRCLVLVTGFFGDRFVEMAERLGAHVDTIRTEIGEHVAEQQLRQAFERAKSDGTPYKAVFCTHVDTSTGIRMDAEMVCRVANEFSALSVFDGVCATVAERFEFSAWNADCLVTGSQKAVGVPCGLTLFVLSQRAMAARKQKKVLPPLYYDIEKWAVVMDAYEEKQTSYFATPATTLVPALEVSLDEILAQGVDQGFERHEFIGQAMRAAWKAMGLKWLPHSEKHCANSMSNLHAPSGMDVNAFLSKCREKGVILSGALKPQLKGISFRVGHMGHSTTHNQWLLKTIQVIEESLMELGVKVEPGSGVKAAMQAGLKP